MFSKAECGSNANVPHYDLNIDETNLFYNSKLIASWIKTDWNVDDISCQVFKDGLTNKLVACINKGSKNCDNGELKLSEENVILVRIHGSGSDLVIDREDELLSMLALHSLECSRPLYGKFNNGIVYGFASGVVLNQQHIHDFDVQRLIIKEMVKLHSLDHRVLRKLSREGSFSTVRPQLFETIHKWMKNIPCHEHPMPQRWSKQRLECEVDLLEHHLSSLNSPVVFCHNDLLPKNIIYDADLKKVSFIDFEYTFFNYQAFDIGNFFCEFAGMTEVDYNLYPSREFQMKWLTIFLETYNNFHKLNKAITLEDVDVLYKQVSKFSLASHIFWAIWAVIQAEHSNIDFNYIEFARKRLDEYEKRKDEFLSLSIIT
ncbi:hypothetical protein HELRODRAFT_79532 [Helobdella robusta]|uniref:ethanolamine kinase n=1 Tax=Helobdella robusta TaxID=6412 RepID=T1G3P8_HELRO|nr:hypothetical protein HELRODRAFT_79532 [Helobdella robusta]ESO03956.1 hypothetical protein HELRODRAFT_79532 [Helobdella robusta]